MRRRGFSSRRVALLVAAVLAATPLLGVPKAGACSCIPSDPRDDLHAADGAFIGTYIGREPTDPTNPYADYDYIFETETVFKGDLGDVVRVRSASNGAACGLEYGEGATGALFLRDEGGVWWSGLCSTTAPDNLRAAARPFAPPETERPRLLIGGSFGEVRVIALDARGRTAGYGYGDGDALDMSLCPQAKASVEVVGSPFANSRPFVDVRRVADLSVQRTLEGPARWRDGLALPLAVECVSPDGDSIVSARGFDGEGEFSEIVRLDEDGATTIDEGDLASVTLGLTSAYGADGREIVAIDYDARDRHSVRSMDRAVSHLALSPDGKLLAGLHRATGAEDGDGVGVFTVRLADGSIVTQRRVRGAIPGSIEWIDRDTLLLSRRYPTALVLNRRLERKTTFGWFASSSVRLGCRLFGAGQGALARVSLCERDDGTIVRRFFSPITYALAKLPAGTQIDAPPR